MNVNLVPTSEKEMLKEKYLVLKSECVKLLTDKEMLLQQGKPQLEALYISKIGYRQLQLLKIQFETKRLKKMSELAVTYLNKNKPIDWNVVSTTTNDSLKQDYKKIMQEASKIDQANILLNNLISTEESVELRNHYRQLAKKLHPDVNPDLSENKKKLWYAVKRAYELCELESLKAFSIMIQDMESISEKFSIGEFQSQIELLKKTIEKLIFEIEQIHSVFPFNIEDNLGNEEWVNQQNEQTEVLIKQELERRKKYKERIDLLKSI